MAADISSPVTPAADRDGMVAVPTRAHRVRAWVLLAFAAWNLLVWGTRFANMLGERTEWSVGFVVVHLLLFGGGIAGAAVLGTIGWRMRREARAGTTSA